MAEIDWFPNTSRPGPYTPSTGSQAVPTQGPRDVQGNLRPVPQESFPHSTPQTSATIHQVSGGVNGGPTATRAAGIPSQTGGGHYENGKFVKQRLQ